MYIHIYIYIHFLKVRGGQDSKKWNIAIFDISGVLGFFTSFGWYVWAKLSQRVKQVCRIRFVKTIKTCFIAEIAGTSRKFADICFKRCKTNISSMCCHGPMISNTCLSMFCFRRTNSRNPWCPDQTENEPVRAAVWQNHWSHFFLVHRNVCFPSRFFNPRWSIALFFSCTWVLQVGVRKTATTESKTWP